MEVLVKDGVNHPDIDDKKNDEETNERITEWIHASHLTDNKLLRTSINNVTVDIGKNKDWSITDYKEKCKTTIDGKDHLKHITNMYYNNDDTVDTDKTLKIPITKKGRNIQSKHCHQNKIEWS